MIEQLLLIVDYRWEEFMFNTFETMSATITGVHFLLDSRSSKLKVRFDFRLKEKGTEYTKYYLNMYLSKKVKPEILCRFVDVVFGKEIVELKDFIGKKVKVLTYGIGHWPVYAIGKKDKFIVTDERLLEVIKRRHEEKNKYVYSKAEIKELLEEYKYL